MRNIVLVGFMGTGKSAVGRTLARKLKMKHVDMDQRIVRRQGRSIARIFEEAGEARFRELERVLVCELAEMSNLGNLNRWRCCAGSGQYPRFPEDR